MFAYICEPFLIDPPGISIYERLVMISNILDLFLVIGFFLTLLLLLGFSFPLNSQQKILVVFDLL